MATDNPIKVGGPYVENEDHVPNPTDMVAQFNTEGVGAHQRIEEVSPIFEVDKVKVAAEVEAALDPKNTQVSSDRVLLPEAVTDNETAKKALLERTKATLKQGVVIGGPTPAEREAGEEGDEGVLAAVDQENKNAASNSTGARDAGQHDGAGSPDETRTSASQGPKATSKRTSREG